MRMSILFGVVVAASNVLMPADRCYAQISFGPRPELVPAEDVVFSFAAPRPPEAVSAAVRSVATALQLHYEADGDGIRLHTAELPPRLLDDYCKYPAINTKTGEPLDTFKSLQLRLANTHGKQQPVRGTVVISLRFPVKDTQPKYQYRALSHCVADVGRYSNGGETLSLYKAPASSRGALERAFLERLLAELGFKSTTEMRRSSSAQADLGFQEQCPLVQEVDIKSLFSGMKRLSVPGHPRRHCRGIALSEVQIRALHGLWSPIEQKVVPGSGLVLVIQPRVSVPRGESQWLRVRAELLLGGEVIAAGQERIDGEEGEVNWGDGIRLALPPADTNSPPILRLEIDAEGNQS